MEQSYWKHGGLPSSEQHKILYPNCTAAKYTLKRVPANTNEIDVVLYSNYTGWFLTSAFIFAFCFYFFLANYCLLKTVIMLK